MGLFSLFKKTNATPAELEPLSAEEAARLAANSEAARQNSQALQRDIARATAMKIDAIESAMAFDIFNTPEFAQPNGSFGSAAFGSITSTFTDPRVVQLAIRISR